MRGMTKRAATGALIGLALGDALGRPTEFLDTDRIRQRYGPWRELPLPEPATVTDDTDMTIAVARALRTAASRGRLAPLRLTRPLREEFVEWAHRPQGLRAPGRTCLKAVALLTREDRPWQDASQLDSKGCGATMRVAPIGLFPGLSDTERSAAAQLQAALTHGHPTALAAADLTARAVYLLAQGTRPAELVARLVSYAQGQRRVYHERWLGTLWLGTPHRSGEDYVESGWDECLKILARLDAAQHEADPESDPCLRTGEGWIAEEALATALLAFLLFPEEPLTALRRAACTVGDSDSLACLTGAFAGAYLGAGAWPDAWAARVEFGDELRDFGAQWDQGLL
ncbi:ADP-ribosylglycohydrolase family protein [Streptomyces polyrhachis]|uniref:ADP-ribosylglycohydrolase family protein n=1 Tax=Streptomyces polyrhachis TaxID=1282885 RepID=A0ABW2GLA0_9ACTN